MAYSLQLWENTNNNGGKYTVQDIIMSKSQQIEVDSIPQPSLQTNKFWSSAYKLQFVFLFKGYS
jgi:hypothetical protein